MIVIPKNYNYETGYYEGIAIVAEEGESKGSKENPFTGEDINKAMKELEEKGLIKDGVASLYIGRHEKDVLETLEESERFFRIIHVE